MLHFIWVFIVSQSTYLGFSGVKGLRNLKVDKWGWILNFVETYSECLWGNLELIGKRLL